MKKGTLYGGLDTGSTICELAVVNDEGEEVLKVGFSTSERNLIRAVEEAQAGGGDLIVALEEGEMAQWIAGVLRPRVKRLVVCDPKRNYWISRSAQKNDKVDAWKLARLLRGGNLKEVYHPLEGHRAEFKRCVQHYHDLTAAQAALQCQIRSKFRSRGVLLRGQDPFSERGREKALEQLEDEISRQILLQEYGLLEKSKQAQQQAKRLMLSVGRSFPEVQYLQTHPGIGPVWACTFSAYVQTPARFKNKSMLWTFCRLGITNRKSDGQPLQRRRLDRNGVGVLKRLSFQAFGACMKGDNDIRAFFLESVRRTQNRTRARLNTQRKILANLYGMWKRQEPYRPLERGTLKTVKRTRA
jgi:transposase